MTPEQRLKDALASSAHDPGPKQDWDGFIGTARRERFVHRAAVVGAALFVIVFVTLGMTVVDNLFDRAAPSPADKNERTERRRDERVDESKEPVRKGKKKPEEARIVPGPGEIEDDEPSEVAVVETDGESGENQPSQNAREANPAGVICRGALATIVGTPRDDLLRGTSGRDVISALGGDDVVRSAGGDDLICGGDNADRLLAGSGRDSLLGGPGDDRLDGGEGVDFVHFPTAPLDINVNFDRGFVEGDGADKVTDVEGMEGTGFGDNLVGDEEANVLMGRGGDDAMNGNGGDDFFVPGPGDDMIAGHQHSDTVDFSTSGAGIELDLTVQTAGEGAVATGEGSDRMNGVENVIGSAHDDVISGNRDRNTISGGTGNDSLSGDDQADVLLGRAGDDSLDGGPGSDALDGGAGEDTCTGGEDRKSCERKGPAGALLILGALARLLFLVRRRNERSEAR